MTWIFGRVLSGGLFRLPPVPNLLFLSPMNVLLATVDATSRRALVSGVNQKCFVSSLFRTLYSGRILAVSSKDTPLFKVERKQLEERHADADGIAGSRDRAVCRQIREHARPGPDDWVIVADPASIAVRNIDHLVPPEIPGPYAPPKADFLWAPAAPDGAGRCGGLATPGVWAVRGEHLETVLSRWESAAPDGGTGAERVEAWTGVVRELPLSKRRFERGEVLAPEIGAVDWRAVSKAALITVPDWSPEEQWQFLQALYLRICLGDETGMMLGVLEA